MARIACLSDIHMGGGDGADDFYQDEMLVQTLRKENEESDAIYLLGDTVDYLQTPLEQAEDAHPTVFQAIEDNVDRIFKGNHDARLDHLCGIELEISTVYRGVLFEHGNRFDRLTLGNLAWVGQIGVNFTAFMERLINPDVDKWFDWLEWKLLNRGHDSDQHKHRQHYLDFIWDEGPALDISRVVTGHSHVWSGEGPVYYNDGCWTHSEHGVIHIEV